MQIASLMLLVLTVTVPLSQCREEPLELKRPGLPMVDSLLACYSAARKAAERSDEETLLALMEPQDALLLRALAVRHGYSSLRSYLFNSMYGWPDPDTLSIVDVKRYGEYARLTLAGTATASTSEYHVIRYTAIMFKEHDSQWRLSAITSIERDRYDLFGQEMGIHDTDFPPRFRFPRSN